MVHLTESQRANRAPRSELDRRAINATGYLLLGFVLLERRVASVSERVESLIEMAPRSKHTNESGYQ